ncbi:MAG: hypothetical protein ABEJ95_02015 [Candidatus Nanohalobium sp.]
MREIQKYRYVMAGVLTVAVFVLGVLFSNFMDDTRYQSLENEMQQTQVEMESRQLQLSYLKSSEVQSCDAIEAGLKEIVEGYNKRLRRVQQYQENSFFQEEQFRTMKREYILSGIRYWLYAQELRDRCDNGSNTVLFFTSSLFSESECDECSSLGTELTLLKKEYGEELLVFTVPTSLDDGAVEMLEKQYNITETPAVVLNGEEKLEGFHSSDEIEEELNLSGKER